MALIKTMISTIVLLACIQVGRLEKSYFTNTWVLHMPGGERVVRDFVEKHDFEYQGTVGSLPDLYRVAHPAVAGRSRRSAVDYKDILESHPQVLMVRQQVAKSRQKRGFQMNDPFFTKQWYLMNTGQTDQRCHNDRHDINVAEAWSKGFTGKGVVVTILDDGIEHTHPDLEKNYDSRASNDFNNGNEREKDPMPRYTTSNINKHGTRCAGEVAALANNGICGTGVAFKASIGGIRMLDGDVTDAVEAGSLSYNPQHIEIYSSSWGPDDDGKTVDGPGSLAQQAFIDGITAGRNGSGSIFVWATGNGGRFQDYCSCDGYINSPYTVSIGAVDNCGKKPWYSEPCPGTLAVTYSSGEQSGAFDKQISTTDLRHKCTDRHTGTSAAAPLAAGIFALVLEANKKLSWRDLQHTVVHTSKKVDMDDKLWKKNAAGHHFNPKYGFGALDTSAMIRMVQDKKWKTAKPQHICDSTIRLESTPTRPNGKEVVSRIYADGCETDKHKCVTKLEHVHVIVTLKKKHRRGELEIDLISPHSTQSAILRRRPRDNGNTGFQAWAFLTVAHWDESPKGTWELRVRDHGSYNGTLVKWQLRFYGTCSVESMFNIHINESEICDNICKKGCPNTFSDECYSCDQYCDCTVGQCVKSCGNHLRTDNQRRHCKRNLEYPMYSAHDVSTAKQPVMKISLFAKFTIICLAVLAICVLVAGIAYFAAKMPKEALGYHAVARYPGTDFAEDAGEADEDDEKVHLELTEPVNS